MANFVLKVKSKKGQNIINRLSQKSTIEELKNELTNVTGIPMNKLHVLYGFPPKKLDITQDSMTLCDAKLSSGETLIIEESQSTTSVVVKPELKQPQPIANEPPKINNSIDNSSQSEGIENRVTTPGILMKKIVPSDNSCLFSSIHYVLNGKEDQTGTVSSWMREIIAETVSKDEGTFSEAILGKPNKEYCVWIQDDKSWGGAIELAVLSNYYGIEIAVVDTINAIINKFGEDQSYPHRVFLLFDGIHYDPLFWEPYDGSSNQTIFSSEDLAVLKEAEQLAIEAKSSRQFTDVNKFTLKCLVCNTFMSGQVQAQQHAQSTGHTNFGEV